MKKKPLTCLNSGNLFSMKKILMLLKNQCGKESNKNLNAERFVEYKLLTEKLKRKN